MYLKVTVTYKGEPLSAKYFNEHPEIHKHYISLDMFLKICNRLRGWFEKTGQISELKIIEDKVLVNDVVVLSRKN